MQLKPKLKRVGNKVAHPTLADGKYINHAIPELVKPNNQKGEKYENKPF